ncbi:heat shock protein transcriptional repressor HspR [Corynebacterium sphenisci]|uniref:heat shock protein transcriptional repressor HspR n=1 Tax=Corynebacterium sphenisci TaxID=191493 RepID=UPI00095113B0|nr:MerR family transcriptional regulator [Corynebacterium sphenisci]
MSAMPEKKQQPTEVYVISVAAELAGMHAQTLRNYDRLGIVTPRRTRGGGRRYTARDVALLREVQRLSQEEGVNLAGIKSIIELTAEVDRLKEDNARLREELARTRREAAPRRGELVHVPRSTAVVMWDRRARRRGSRGEGTAPGAERG